MPAPLSKHCAWRVWYLPLVTRLSRRNLSCHHGHDRDMGRGIEKAARDLDVLVESIELRTFEFTVRGNGY